MVRDDGRAGKTGLISDQGGGIARAQRAGLVSWCLYDWANSAFSTIVSTFVFPVYFTQMVARDPIQGAAHWSYAVAAAALAVALGARRSAPLPTIWEGANLGCLPLRF